tara:strand:- start:461 stop:634 length:174 start_codon:yes stop_codon:yes gene_type:complete
MKIKKIRESMNILNHAVEYYDMMYDGGDKRHNEEEKNNVWNALNYIGDQLYKKKERT